MSPRLCRILAPRMKKLGVELNPKAPFRAPPTTTTDLTSRAQGIEVMEFPAWFVCQNPDCRTLYRPQSHNLPKSGRLVHDGCGAKAKKWECVPVRFVATCKRGHLEEFPWMFFVHNGQACAAPRLALREGVSGNLSEIRLECVCRASRSLADALIEQKNPLCGGARPWLGSQGAEACEHHLRLLVRTATNTYFSHCESALSIPEPKNELKHQVEGVMDVIGSSTSADDLAWPRKKVERVAKALAGFSDEEVLRTIRQLNAGEVDAREGLRSAEYRQFMAQAVDKGEVPPRADEFFARRWVPKAEQPLPPQIERVVLARKLREVRVQLGFTRSEPVATNLEGEYDLGVELARVGLNDDWLPASEIRGEGLFIRLDEGALVRWEQRPPPDTSRAPRLGHRSRTGVPRRPRASQSHRRTEGQTALRPHRRRAKCRDRKRSDLSIPVGGAHVVPDERGAYLSPAC